MTTCVSSGGGRNGVIKFTDVKITSGIHNTDLIRNSGIFTCENPGLYLISVFTSIDSRRHGEYDVYKINNVIANGTTSLTVIVHLTVNDTISVQGRLPVYHGLQSCLTIIKIQ